MSDLDKAKAALAYLMDHIVYSDSYGVHGSDFAACHLCRGGGAPGVALIHEPSCPAAHYGDVAQEWWDERDAERKEAADEIVSLRAQLVAKNEHLHWIKGYAALMTADNWRDMQLRIERQATMALTDGAGHE